VVKADHTVEVRTVTIGITQGTSTSIANGLKAGETIVSDGFENLQPGSHVNIRSATTGAIP